MTTDLSNKSVEELFMDNYSHEDLEVVANELARRLEEAQQRISDLEKSHELVATAFENRIGKHLATAKELEEAQQKIELAKAEALEEAIERLWERVGREEYGHAKAAVTLDIEAIRELAAEYRDKAKGEPNGA